MHDWPTTTCRPIVVLAGSPVGEDLRKCQHPNSSAVCCWHLPKLEVELWKLSIGCSAQGRQCWSKDEPCLAAWTTVRSPMHEKAWTLMLFKSARSTAPLQIETCSYSAPRLVCLYDPAPQSCKYILAELTRMICIFMHGMTTIRRTRSNRSQSPMMTASGAIQVSGAAVGVRVPKEIICRCLYTKVAHKHFRNLESNVNRHLVESI